MSAPKRVYWKMMACSLRGRPRSDLAPSVSSISLADLPSQSPGRDVDRSEKERKKGSSYRHRALAALSASAPDLRRHFPAAATPPPSTPRGTASPSHQQQQQQQQQQQSNDERPDLYEVDLEEDMIGASSFSRRSSFLLRPLNEWCRF
jgi:hypothetical protein